MKNENIDEDGEDATYKFTVVVPRGPTWFRTSALACLPWQSKEGTSFSEFAFMSYELLCIYKIMFGQVNGEEGYYIEFQQQLKAHNDAITSVTANRCNGIELTSCLFVTSGSDHFIRIWNKQDEVWKLKYQTCLRQDVDPVACDSLSLTNSTCILAGSSAGHVIVWDVVEEVLPRSPIVKKFDKDCATCCCWLNSSNLDASTFTGVVGYKSGIACAYAYKPATLVNEGQLSALFRINAHDCDVCGLIPVTLFHKENGHFASSGRDSTIKEVGS